MYLKIKNIYSKRKNIQKRIHIYIYMSVKVCVKICRVKSSGFFFQGQTGSC